MYSYQTGLKDEDVFIKEGQYLGGAPIGIILFGKTGYAFPPGSIENATTFKYPVLFKAIEAASVSSVVSVSLDDKVLEELIEAGRELETQGCRAIVGACGYFANYLPAVVRKLNVPCFFSSLMQVPLILRAIRPNKKVGILCADGQVLKSGQILKNCGVDNFDSVVIYGAEVLPEMQKILKGVGHYNPYRLEQGLIDLARDMVKKNPAVEAILLECTLFPTHAHAIQDALRLPVFDFSTLIDWIYSAVVRRPFAGYM
ncbi:MAG: aspartate/glutamate racemase family protein [Deltaproteobacteria bacterium]|nr:aspartate/glutamate racemase family protein [Deltaproteobacteria bacterium]